MRKRRYAFPGTGKRRGMGMKQQTLAHLLIRRAEGTGNHYRPGILQYLGMEHWTPHALRRTGSTISINSDIRKRKSEGF